ncbi:hypothetical protein AMTR_s00128p00115470 [Amborella trichopoda]|uniref:Reverse transcriptase domain-containing protein n=1 Tax=Amborella trichopoda TaxID=13333 RepID=W1NLW3_AMBTC|nr:hypothetical protein AMTR_s00128p00115470 [Amborella trichopoda]
MEFIAMSFRLTNAPTTFCHLMNDILSEYIDSFVAVYLNDIAAYSQTLDDHVRHLGLVLERVRANQLSVKLEKWIFTQKEIMFLRHKVGRGKIEMDDQKGIRKRLSLTNLLRKGVKWEWMVDFEQSFQKLKRAITSKPVRIPGFDKPFWCRLMHQTMRSVG